MQTLCTVQQLINMLQARPRDQPVFFDGMGCDIELVGIATGDIRELPGQKLTVLELRRCLPGETVKVDSDLG